jgi:hypothetical protein
MRDVGDAAGECSAMTAKQLIEDAGAYGPEQIELMSQALEGAWTRIEGGLRDRKAERDHVRLKLAQTILAIAADGVGTAKEMQDEAIKRMFAEPTEL